jgi:hypothetical protein
VTASLPGFKGNKASLPTKACEQCGRAMTWRKAWAKNWEAVKYCSERCRKAPHAVSPKANGVLP